MRTRTLQGILACILFVVASQIHQWMHSTVVDVARVLVWSAVGVGIYVGLSRVLGFDPNRTRISSVTSPLMHYLERWELRSGSATLTTTLGVYVLAMVFDNQHFVTAVVSGTLSAWFYFMLRVYVGGYEPAKKKRS